MVPKKGRVLYIILEIMATLYCCIREVLLWSWWSCRDLALSYFCHFSFTSRQHTKNSPQIQITMWLQVRVRHGTNPYYQLTTHCTDWYCASTLTCFYNEIYLSKKKHLNWRCLLYSQQQTFSYNNTWIVDFPIITDRNKCLLTSVSFKIKLRNNYPTVTSARSCNKVESLVLIYNSRAARDQWRHSVYS